MTYIPKSDSYQNIVSVNSDGHIQMERTDFYNSLGLNYVKFLLQKKVKLYRVLFILQQERLLEMVH